jgi:bifunctional hydroxylase/dehydrase
LETDVVIVGAGPAGLMLAGELRLAGVRTVVLERLERPCGQSRGLGFTTRTQELLDQRGLLPRFGPLELSPWGHFGGLPFDYTVLPGAQFGVRNLPQARIEAGLEGWATDSGADVRRGWEFRSYREDADGVEVAAAGPAGPATLRAAYLVGCDGGHSAVRKAAGIGFPGSAARHEMLLADVRGVTVRPRPLGERRPGGLVMVVPLGDGVDRVIVSEPGARPARRTGEPAFAEVADALRRVTGEDIGAGTPLWVSAFTDVARQAERYRAGRVLLAGDAAHVVLPAGGQGLSTGVQDAANLGWKLAAAVNGWAPADLLDSYERERHAVGARLLWNTRAQAALILGGEEAEPMRRLVAELLGHDDVKRHLAGIVSGLDVRYDVGPGDHPLLGRRLPGVELAAAAGPTTTTALLRPGQALLLDLADSAAVRDTAAGWKDRVLVATATPAAGDPFAGAAALLVRPDGYVVGTDPADLPAALQRWFGPPAAG